ncbi:membrane protein [Roseivivax isoporae LMG 25204]|uniref:Membrane protein n=1 Tax=Roseivivax isoporae LMG 25204 TaxID=1449351 RepID=X7FG45_9RHOB|nr:membrane protein [Roseivivax isoporae LMG 25204]
MSDNARGAVLMMVSMAAFTANDALIKRAGADLPLMQIIATRGVVASLALAALAWATGAFRARVSARDAGLVAFRSAAEVGAAWFYLTALLQMPLANVMALLQTLPLTVTLAAALVFGEPVGWRRWSAIGLGFLGMLLIVRPGTEGFDAYTTYALIAVGFVTARDLVVRRMSAELPAILVTLAASVAVTVFAALLSLGERWEPFTPASGAMVLGAAALVSLAYLLSVLVMRTGEVGAIAPFRYTGLVWALLLGWFVFGDWPQALTLAGAALIAGSGVFTLARERRLRRRTATPAGRPIG